MTVPTGEELVDVIEKILDDDNNHYKWGNAGCIDVGGDEYIFFGWGAC